MKKITRWNYYHLPKIKQAIKECLIGLAIFLIMVVVLAFTGLADINCL